MAVRASRPRCRVTRLANGLMGDAARIDDRDVRGAVLLDMPVEEQALTDLLGVRVRDLAAEKADRECGHGRRETLVGPCQKAQPRAHTSAPQPSRSRCSRCLKPATCGLSVTR